MKFDDKLYRVVSFQQDGNVVLRDIATQEKHEATMLVDLNIPQKIYIVKLDSVFEDSGQ